MKVAFAGPSGGGKTTLANYIAEKHNLQYLRGSASFVMNDEDKAYLNNLGYKFTGHKEVIEKSANASFALAFQTIVQKRRGELIINNDNFITDRSPIDNVAYFLSEAAYQSTDFQAHSFIQESKKMLPELTHLIFIRSVNPDTIEDNNSRIPNKYYQRCMDAIFIHTMAEHFHYELSMGSVQLLTIDYWDLEQRKAAVDEFLQQ